MQCNSTRTSVVLAALVVAAVAVSGPSAVAQRKDDKDKKPAEGGLTAAQRQEAAPLARLADEVMKGAAPGTYLVTAKEPSSKEIGRASCRERVS